MAFDKQKYDNEFIKTNYDNIVLRLPKGKREVVKKAAANHGKSVNTFIVDALESCYHIDLSKD